MGNSFFRKVIDALVYLFVVIFSVLYIIPEYLLDVEKRLGFDFCSHAVLIPIGQFLMLVGLAIALWSAFHMSKYGKGTPIPSSSPTELVTTGPYAIVRQPMMWSLYIVLLGEALNDGSILILVWVFVLARFGVLFIDRYEEPLLEIEFGEAHKKYCESVPCWIPDFKRENKG